MISQLARALIRHFTGVSPRDALCAYLPIGPNALPARLIDNWDEPRVMVLAPHPDDEALGCGGSLLKHAKAGALIHIVYVTDGRRGDRQRNLEAARAARAGDQETLVQIRKSEAQAVALALCKAGAQAQAIHLDAEDGRLAVTTELIQALAAIIVQAQPVLLYLPFVLDTHEDHWQTNLLANRALAQTPAAVQRSLRLRGYEVWSPLPANCVADISDVMEAKLELARCHASQIQAVDYLHAIKGLNAYRSMALPHSRAKGYAEALYEATVPAYASMIERVEMA